MGLAKLYWLIYHRISIIYQFIQRKIIFYILSQELLINTNNNKKELWIIYDLSISPLAYGEVFDSLMLARSLQSKGKKVKFFFTKGLIRTDYKKNIKNKEQLNKRFREIILLSNCLLNKKNISFRKLTLNEIIIRGKLKKKKILFLKSLKNKIPLYKYTHNLCFVVFKYLSKKSKNAFLLNRKNYGYINTRRNSFKNYICIGVRMALNNEKNRNLKIFELNKLIKKIRQKHREYIIIICDLESYKILKVKKNLINDNKIKFSKDYFKNFVDDGNLILNSKKYYQYKGTGIQMFAEFSNIKFEIFHDFKDYTIFANILRSDLYYNYKKKIKNIWQNKNQSFFQLEDLN